MVEILCHRLQAVREGGQSRGVGGLLYALDEQPGRLLRCLGRQPIRHRLNSGIEVRKLRQEAEDAATKADLSERKEKTPEDQGENEQ